MVKDYYLIIKTAQSEIRAIEFTDSNVLNQIFPVIELTRGRKKTVDDVAIYPFENNLKRLKNSFIGMDVAIDATSDDSLSCEEIDRLYDYTDGYNNWTTLLIGIKNENCFKSITPTVLMNFEDPNFKRNIKKQIETLTSNFDSIMYRSSITDEYCYDDIPMILKVLPNNKFLKILIDCGYTPQAMENNMEAKLQARIKNIKKIINSKYCSLAFCATSFPNNISEIGSDDYDIFKLSEVDMHNKIRSKYSDVAYGDYGSINPVRNDNIVMARGWIPRIDVPLDDTVYYYRQRRAGGAYSDTYRTVAKKVVDDEKFPAALDCWGIKQIKSCEDLVPSASPSHWISVRMNIHIVQQLKRLNALDKVE